MSELTSARRRKPLIEGRQMTCPRCKTPHEIFKYVPLEVIEEYAAETTPCYKCPKCKWIFAPADPLPHKLILDLQELVTNLQEQIREKETVPTS